MRLSRRGELIGLCALGLAVLVFVGSAAQLGMVVDAAWAQSSVRPPANAVNNVRPPAPPPANAPTKPGESRPQDAKAPFSADPQNMTSPVGELGPNSDATLWGEVRHGQRFTVSIPDKKAAVLVKSGGVAWERTVGGKGPLGQWGAKAIAITLAVLAIFYLLRGRVRLERGFSGRLIERFSGIERFCHWLTASSFVLLALTGLELLYGRGYLIPLIGKGAFADIAAWGKWTHNNVAWAFMLGLVLIFVTWVANNLPTRADLVWLAKGGGILAKGVHPPSHKFNAGQKLIFWAIILLGISISLSGLSLLFPYDLPMFSKTFAALNQAGFAAVWGAPLPTDLTPTAEMQYAQLWHAIVALAMIVIVLAHIYIGTLGMEGAFSAMGTGTVDLNWAKEHHDLWVEELEEKGRSVEGTAATPAE